MSRLPNSPLVEVVFELRWKIETRDDLLNAQYLYGDIYSELKKDYPFRELIVPIEIPIEAVINQPVHRFRKEENGYPLFQVGPGIVTFNTIDSLYYWDKFSSNCKELIDAFIKVFSNSGNRLMIPSILYIDFFEFDFEQNDVNEFINKNFHLSFEQNFIENKGLPTDLNLGFFYRIEIGNLSIAITKGKKSNQKNGIIIHTRIDGVESNLNSESLITWLEQAHNYTSDIFKKLTAGELYDSFK